MRRAPASYGFRVRSDKALRNAFRRLQLPTSDDPTNVFAAIVPAVPTEIGQAWEELHDVDEDLIAFAFSHPRYAHLLTAGVTLPTFREELEWILRQFDEGLPVGDVIDVGAGAGVTAAVVALATRRSVVAVEPAAGAKAAIDHVAETVGAAVTAIEAPASALTEDYYVDGIAVAIAQSVLAYNGFGGRDNSDDQIQERSALVATLCSAGEALVIEHTTNTRNTSNSSAVWRSFVTEMSKVGMYPVWETATIVTGYTTFVPDTPPHMRRDFLRPKLCLRFSRFSNTGDPHNTESRLQTILAENPTGCGYDN